MFLDMSDSVYDGMKLLVESDIQRNTMGPKLCTSNIQKGVNKI